MVKRTILTNCYPYLGEGQHTRLMFKIFNFLEVDKVILIYM